jgi:hypothetical protein
MVKVSLKTRKGHTNLNGENTEEYKIFTYYCVVSFALAASSLQPPSAITAQ